MDIVGVEPTGNDTWREALHRYEKGSVSLCNTDPLLGVINQESCYFVKYLVHHGWHVKCAVCENECSGDEI